MSRPKASVDVGYYPNGDVGLQVKHEDEQIVNVRMARDLVVGALAEWMTRDAKDLWIELPAEDGRPIRLHQAVRIVPALQAALDRREPAVPLSEDGRPV